MTYQLKKIQYCDRDVQILLQNENGPCPLIAACNCLLLKGSVVFPPQTVNSGFTSLDDITNMLADYAMSVQHQSNQSSSTNGSSSFDSDTQSQFNLNEFMNLIPNFQYGMDVNPKFNMGCLGFEYTAELSVLSDMLGCKLVHGWLIDPIQDEATALAIGSKSYNELIDQSIICKEAELEVSKIQGEIENLLFQHQQTIISAPDLLENQHDSSMLHEPAKENLDKLRKKQNGLQDVAIATHLIEAFLASSSHQLTNYGLEQLYDSIGNGEVAILFRNNHFSTIARHGEYLYVLVTDLGYANTSSIVWEKLDVVDGDAEFCDCFFICNQHVSLIGQVDQTARDNIMPSNEMNDVDYQLALQISLQGDRSEAVNIENPNRNLANLTNSVLTTGTIATLPSVPHNARVEMGVPISDPTLAVCTQEEADRLLAIQLQQQQHANHGDVETENDEASLKLIRQIQMEDNERQATLVSNNNPGGGSREALPLSNGGRSTRASSSNSNCIVM